MKLYPVMVNLSGRLAVVIGGGEVASRKVLDLVEAGADVKVVSPEFTASILTAAESSISLQLVKREYTNGDLDGAMIVFSATNNPDVNKKVFSEAEKKGILINAVDDPPNCSFFVPSFIRKGELLLSLSTGGASPAMAARLRREIEKYIPDNIDIILEKLKDARTILKEAECFSCTDSPKRGEILKKIVNDDMLLEAVNSCSSEEEMIAFLSGVKESCR